MILKKGFLVAFEGIDGAGKTTQAQLLYSYLISKDVKTILSKEPTDSLYGQKIKKLALGEREVTSPEDEYRLFVNDRKIHVENLIKPALSNKKVVILDRYYFSNIAYQGAIGLDTDNIRKENEAFSPIPEIVFLIQVPPRVGIRRIQRGREEEPNLFEREENLTKVAEIYSTIAGNYIVPIRGTGTIDEIHTEIVNVIDDVIDHYIKRHEQYLLFKEV